MIHKYYGIRDEKEVRRGTVISTFFAFLVAGGGYFIGSFSHLFFGDQLPEGGKDYLIPNMLNMSNLPDILVGIVLVLLYFRLRFHPLQYHTDSLLYSFYGSGKRSYTPADQGSEPCYAHPTTLPILCGGFLSGS